MKSAASSAPASAAAANTSTKTNISSNLTSMTNDLYTGTTALTSAWYHDMTDMLSGGDPTAKEQAATKVPKLKKDDRSNEETNEKEDEEKENESMICATVRSIRAKYLERRLVGKIYIRRLFGVILTAVTSDITSEDITNHYLKLAESKGRGLYDQDPLVHAEITGQYKRALSTVDTLLNSLERRSLAYSSAEFSHNTMLTRGTTIGVNDPFFHILGFSFTLELSATAQSLIASRKRYEAARDIALSKKRRESGDTGISPLSMLSFSVFGKQDTSPENIE